MRLDVISAARDWIGTPYVHQAATKGAGCDCLGLIRGVWRELGCADVGDIPPYSMDWSEPQGEERLWRAAVQLLVPKARDAADIGDVLLFRMRDGSVAKHLGLQSSLGATSHFIHAYQGHGVVEANLTAPWQRRIVARFAFPFD